MKTLKLLLLILFVLFIQSCDKDDEQNSTNTFCEIEHPLTILNEGSFTNNNASISVIDASNAITNNLFESANNYGLGDVAQSIEWIDGLAYIVVNNSGKIEVVNPVNYERTGTIINLPSPRYIKKVSNNKAYVSNFYSSAISIIDLNAYSVSGSIDFPIANNGFGLREQIEVVNNEAFVVEQDSSGLIIINTINDEVVDFMTLPAIPRNIVKDVNNFLWVFAYDFDDAFNITNQQLIKINGNSRDIVLTIPINNSVPFASLNLIVNKDFDTLFLLLDDIYSLDINDNAPSVYFEIPDGIIPYGFNVDAENYLVFITDPIDFSSQSDVHIFNTVSECQQTFKAGIGASKIYY